MNYKKYIASLIIDNKAASVAEIGIDRGRLCRKILRTTRCDEYLEEYWGIDKWTRFDEFGREYALENIEEKSKYLKIWADKDSQWCDGLCFKAYKYMFYYPKLRLVRLPSYLAVRLFPDNYFDFVFIDASHLYEDVVKDITLWLPKVRKGGILSGHDYNHPKHEDVAKAVHDVIGADNIDKKIVDTVYIYRV